MSCTRSLKIYNNDDDEKTADETKQIYLPRIAYNMWLELDLDSVHADSTIDMKIQHSPDGVDWYDLLIFNQVVGVDGKQLKKMDSSVRYLRAVLTIAGTTKSVIPVLNLYYCHNYEQRN